MDHVKGASLVATDSEAFVGGEGEDRAPRTTLMAVRSRGNKNSLAKETKQTPSRRGNVASGLHSHTEIWGPQQYWHPLKCLD